MFATVRSYTGIGSGTLSEIDRRRDEIEALIRSVPGLVAYHMLRTRDGITTVTVCNEPMGAEVSNRRVAAWIQQEMADFVPKPPDISAGEVLLQILPTQAR